MQRFSVPAMFNMAFLVRLANHRKCTILLLILFVVYDLFLVSQYWHVFTGDPEIHIIFAQNLLDGYPLQFNKGEFTSGETSPLYMVIVALFLLLSPTLTPVFMKLTGFIALISIAWNIFYSLEHTPHRRAYPALDRKPYDNGDNESNDSDQTGGRKNRGHNLTGYLYTISLVMTPFMIFQASLGMENMLFAAMVVYLCRKILLERSSGPLLFFYMPFLMFLLRPEAVLVMATLMLIAGWDRKWKDAAFCSAALLCSFLFLSLVEFWTGAPLHGAGAMRAFFSRQHHFHFDFFGYGIDIFLHKRPLIILLYTFPFIFFYLKNLSHIEKNGLLATVLLFAAPLILHFTTVFPAIHFIRYFLYAYATFILIFSMYCYHRISKTHVLLLSLFLLAGGTVESLLRTKNIYEDFRDTNIQFNDAFVKENSDALIKRIKPSTLPVSILIGEVQIRGRLDDRFIVRPFDGIVDYKLRDYIRDGSIDLFAYIKNRNIDAILETPGGRGTSLQDLNKIETPLIQYGGLCFSRFAIADLEGLSVHFRRAKPEFSSVFVRLKHLIFKPENLEWRKENRTGYKVIDCGPPGTSGASPPQA